MKALLTALLLAGSVPAAAGPTRVSLQSVLHPTAKLVLQAPLPKPNAWAPTVLVAQVTGKEGTPAWVSVEPHPRGGLMFAEGPGHDRSAADRPTHIANFEVTDDEVMKININTRGKAGRAVGLSAARAFDAAAAELRGQFREIEGHWSFGDNLAAFNAGVEAGLSEADAARATWTGRQAARHGYTEAVVLENIETSSGRRVVVRFRKP